MGTFDIDRKKEIGERIRQVREEKGMTQADLAEKSGLSLPRISLIELGQTQMKLSSFICIAEALQTSADSLLRLDTEQGRKEYSNEFSGLLDSCKPHESEAIIKITKEILAVMRKANNE